MISEDVESQALGVLVVNRLRGGLKVVADGGPGFGDRRKAMLEDIAILTGGQVISEERLHLGKSPDDRPRYLQKITVDKDNTTIVNGKGKKKDIDSRIAMIKSQIETTTSDYDKEKLQEHCKIGRWRGSPQRRCTDGSRNEREKTRWTTPSTQPVLPLKKV